MYLAAQLPFPYKRRKRFTTPKYYLSIIYACSFPFFKNLNFYEFSKNEKLRYLLEKKNHFWFNRLYFRHLKLVRSSTSNTTYVLLCLIWETHYMWTEWFWQRWNPVGTTDTLIVKVFDTSKTWVRYPIYNSEYKTRKTIIYFEFFGHFLSTTFLFHMSVVSYFFVCPIY